MEFPTRQSATRVGSYLEKCEYVPLNEKFEKFSTDIMRVSRLMYSGAKALLYCGRAFEALVDEEGLQSCDHKYRTPRVKGAATKRR